jgi:glucokinase
MAKLSPNKNGKYMIGVDVGGTNVRAGLVDRQGKVLLDARRPAHATEGMHKTVEMAIEAAREVMTQRELKSADIVGIGVAIAGSLRSGEGICTYSPNFAGPFPVQVSAPFEEKLGIFTTILNDVNTATLGEHRFGAGKGYDQVVMITLGTGIGGGAVVDGKLRIGYTEGFAEVGHHIVDPNGPRCNCGGHGCWEALAARDAIIYRAISALQEGAPSIMWKLAKGDINNITPSLISKAAAQDDELAQEVLDETAFWVGIGCCNLIVMYNPQVLIIGGGIAGALPQMLPTIQRVVDTRSHMVPAKTCRIIPADLGDDAGLIGGAVLVMSKE